MSELNETSWVMEELADVELGDARRDKRFIEVMVGLAHSDAKSLSQAFPEQSDYKAALRFLDSEKFDTRELHEAHHVALMERVAQCRVVYSVSDTTEFDLSSHQLRHDDIGPLGSSEYRKGLKCHDTLLMSPDGVCLGVLDMDIWARDPKLKGQHKQRKKLTIEAKESFKWLRALRRLNAFAHQCPETSFVFVADREADLYDLLAEPREPNVELLIRGCYNRCLDTRDETQAQRLREKLQSQPVAGEMLVKVPRISRHRGTSRNKQRRGRPPRIARVTLRYAQVDFPAVSRSNGESYPSVSLHALLVEETRKPKGQKPINWLLLSTRVVDELHTAITTALDYARRWAIEPYHMVLKTGFRIESRQLKTVRRLERSIVLISLCAWRVAYITMLARAKPEAPATLIVTRREWQALCCRFRRTSTPPSTPPNARDILRMIAKLGGFPGRKCDGEPGYTYVWRGLRRVADIADMYAVMSDTPLVK